MELFLNITTMDMMILSLEEINYMLLNTIIAITVL